MYFSEALVPVDLDFDGGLRVTLLRRLLVLLHSRGQRGRLTCVQNRTFNSYRKAIWKYIRNAEGALWTAYLLCIIIMVGSKVQIVSTSVTSLFMKVKRLYEYYHCPKVTLAAPIILAKQNARGAILWWPRRDKCFHICTYLHICSESGCYLDLTYRTYRESPDASWVQSGRRRRPYKCHTWTASRRNALLRGSWDERLGWTLIHTFHT